MKFIKRTENPDLIPEGLIDDLIKFHEEEPNIEKTLKMVCTGYQEFVRSLIRDYNGAVEEYEKVYTENEELKKRFYN